MTMLGLFDSWVDTIKNNTKTALIGLHYQVAGLTSVCFSVITTGSSNVFFESGRRFKDTIAEFKEGASFSSFSVLQIVLKEKKNDNDIPN